MKFISHFSWKSQQSGCVMQNMIWLLIKTCLSNLHGWIKKKFCLSLYYNFSEKSRMVAYHWSYQFTGRYPYCRRAPICLTILSHSCLLAWPLTILPTRSLGALVVWWRVDLLFISLTHILFMHLIWGKWVTFLHPMVNLTRQLYAVFIQQITSSHLFIAMTAYNINIDRVTRYN